MTRTRPRRRASEVRALDRAERLVPPGFDARRELKLCVVALAAGAAVQSLGFFIMYMSACDNMYRYVDGARVEIPDAIFVPCTRMLMPGIIAFAIVSAAFLALAWRYVSYHFKGGSRCIYTMRRLRRRSEFFVRCAALPLAGLVASQVIWRLLGLLCGVIYMLATPERWLSGGSWEDIVHLITH